MALVGAGSSCCSGLRNVGVADHVGVRRDRVQASILIFRFSSFEDVGIQVMLVLLLPRGWTLVVALPGAARFVCRLVVGHVRPDGRTTRKLYPLARYCAGDLEGEPEARRTRHPSGAQRPETISPRSTSLCIPARLRPCQCQYGRRRSRGAPGFRAWRQETQELLGAEHQLRRAVDVGPDRVLVVTTTITKERRADRLGAAHVERGVGGRGKVTRTEVYADVTEALEAVGLSE